MTNLTVMNAMQEVTTHIGENVVQGDVVTITNEERLKHTLVIGSICSRKLGLTIMPMVIQDLKKSNSTIMVVSSNKNVLEHVLTQATVMNKQIIYLDFTNTKEAKEKLESLQVKDFTNEKLVFLVKISQFKPSFEEKFLYNELKEQVLNSVKIKGQKEKTDILQSLYLVDAYQAVEIFDEIVLGVPMGIAITLTVERLDDLFTTSNMKFDKFHMIFRYNNLVAYPALYIRDKVILKERITDIDKLTSLEFPEGFYCIGTKNGIFTPIIYKHLIHSSIETK